jgi:hypothetical protein
MNQRSVSVSESLGGVAKTLVVLIAGDAAMHLLPAYRNVMFGVGLCVGVIIQLAIPPRHTWKKQILMPIAILVGIAYAVASR